MQPRKTQVATWELVAALAALWHIMSDLESPGAQWELEIFIDSTVALGTLLRGCSRQCDWNKLVSELWFRAAVSGTLMYAWRVPSKQNLADAPTRFFQRSTEMRQLRDAGFKETAWQWPLQWMKLENQDQDYHIFVENIEKNAPVRN